MRAKDIKIGMRLHARLPGRDRSCTVTALPADGHVMVDINDPLSFPGERGTRDVALNQLSKPKCSCPSVCYDTCAESRRR